MRIDLNTQPPNGPEKAANSSNTSAANGPAVARAASAGGARTDTARTDTARTDTAQFLFDRIRTQALAPEPAHLAVASKLRIEALRRVLSEGSYDVPADLIAGAIVTQAKVLHA